MRPLEFDVVVAFCPPKYQIPIWFYAEQRFMGSKIVIAAQGTAFGQISFS